MPNYTKLFSSIVTSTIWTEDDKTRIVWITMLAICDQHGEVHASIPGLARVAGVSLEDAEKAIEKFKAADHYSRTKDHEGRRLVEIPGGWELLNHGKYRRLASKIDKEENNAARQQRHRDREKDRNAGVTVNNATVTPETDKQKQKQKQKQDTDTEAEAILPPSPSRERKASILSVSEADSFALFWKCYPRKTAKGNAEVAWKKGGCISLTEQIVVAVNRSRGSFDWTKEGGAFIPHPATWLNRRSWEDEVFEPVDENRQPDLPDRTEEMGPCKTEERFAKIRAEMDALP